MAGLDSPNVDSINDTFINKHVRHSSIHMNLADGVGTLGLIIHCIRLVSWDHHLISNTTIVILAWLFVLTQVILIDQRLLLFSEAL